MASIAQSQGPDSWRLHSSQGVTYHAEKQFQKANSICSCIRQKKEKKNNDLKVSLEANVDF